MTFEREFRKHTEQLKHKTHCQAGHPLTPANTRHEVCVRSGKEYVVRICKACERERQKKQKVPRQSMK